MRAWDFICNFAEKMRELTRRYVAALLLVLFVGFAAGNTLCVHTHVGPQGAVTHSHPYLPSGHHGHSTVEFSTLAQLNALSYDDSGACSCYALAPLRACEYLMPALLQDCVSAAAVRLHSLRAPPQCV